MNRCCHDGREEDEEAEFKRRNRETSSLIQGGECINKKGRRGKSRKIEEKKGACEVKNS